MQITESFTSVAANVTGLLSNATGATWTLTANDAADSLAHKITIKGDAATDHSAKTAIITGTDYIGAALTETVNLPNGTATVTSVGHFLTVTTVVPSATIGADTMDVGWAAASISPPVNVRSRPGNATSIGIGCDIAGTPTYTLQQSYGGGWHDHASIAGETTAVDGSILHPVFALRMSFAAAGTVVLNLVIAGQ